MCVWRGGCECVRALLFSITVGSNHINVYKQLAANLVRVPVSLHAYTFLKAHYYRSGIGHVLYDIQNIFITFVTPP